MPACKVFELDDILAEDRRRQVFARIAARPAERFDHVVQRELADAEFRGKCRAIERRDQLANAGRIRAADDRHRLDAELCQQLLGRFVILGMDPSRIERLFAADDLQEAGRLHERRVAQPAHFQQLLPAAERPVLLAMFVHPPGGELIHARNVTQQRRARAVELDADKADARLHHVVERVAQVLGPGVVLIQADADAGRVDFHQLAERILQPAADRDRAPLDRIALGKFLAANLARGINARPGFVDDDVVHVLGL